MRQRRLFDNGMPKVESSFLQEGKELGSEVTNFITVARTALTDGKQQSEAHGILFTEDGEVSERCHWDCQLRTEAQDRYAAWSSLKHSQPDSPG